MNKNEPLFKSVFGSAWEKLPPVFQKRYRNRPFSHDVSSVEGDMEINFSKAMASYIPIFRLFHVLVPYKGSHVPVTVDFCSDINDDKVALNRKFYFPGKKPYVFNSRMEIIKDNDVVEWMPFGLGWRTNYFYEKDKVVMQHKAYIWKILGLKIRLPLELFIGRSHAVEEVIDDNSYRITMTISHPLFGTMYNYAGNFVFKRSMA